jgi:serine/threonine protein kinase/WD40 repeat protein
MSADPNRVQAVFAAALEAADPEQQAAILDRECASSPELRRRVDALLRAHRDPASIFDQPAVAPLSDDDATSAAPRPFSCPPVWEGASTTNADAGSFAGPDGPNGARGPLWLGFLEPPPRPGTLGRIGHYEVLELIGRGGFGIVLRAFDEVLQRVVAVKVLAPEIAATSPARKRFLREARSTAAIRHENVVQVYAVEEEPLPYLVMEFIPGETLQQMLDRTGPLDVPEILRIGREIGEGLAAAHDTGLIHRDVKPANVLIEEGPRRRVKLTDFGLARAADDASISQSGLVAGTPLYMAPEQAKGEVLDLRADLFSLGSVLYVMCTGRPPFRAASPMAILRRVCDDAPRPIREIIPEVPAWLCDLIARLHAKDPAGRFPDARAVVDLLDRHQGDSEAGRPGHPTPVPTRATRPGRSRRARLAAVTALLLIGLVICYVLAWRPPPRAGQPPDEPPKKRLWQPRPPPADELSRLSSPFDALDHKTSLPADSAAGMFGGADRVPPELVAVLDGSPARLPRAGRTSWFAQDRDGKWLAVPCETEVVLFDARTMARAKILGAAGDRVYRVDFSPDGKRLAVASWSGEDGATVWDAETGMVTLKLGLTGPCRSIRFSPDGTRLLGLSDDVTAIVWDARSGEELHRFPRHEQPVWPDAIFTADGKRIVTCADRVVKVWDASTWAEVVTLTGPERSTDELPNERHLALAASADGEWLAAGSETGLTVWATATWKEQFHRDNATATWLAFAPDGRTILAAPHESSDGQWHAVTRWDTRTGHRLESAKLGNVGPWSVYHLSVDGKTLYAMACDPAEPSVRVYDAGTFEERIPPGHAGRVCAVGVSPDGASVASAGSDGTLRVWDVATRRSMHVIPRRGETAVQSVFSPDGKALYGAWSEDGTILAVDPVTGRWREFGTYGPGLQRLAVSPDGARLAAVGEGAVRLWALPDGTRRGEVVGVPPSPRSAAFSPDARTLAIGGAESLRLFDSETGRPVGTLDFPGTARWVGFRPDGRSLAAAGESPGHAVLIYDLPSGVRSLRLEGHESRVLGGSWRADGGLLATLGAEDGMLRLWDFGYAMPRQWVVPSFRPNVPTAEAAAFTPDGRHLVTGGPDGTIAIFRLAKVGGVFRVQ